MPLRTLAGLTVACTALLVPLTGCTADHGDAPRQGPATAASAPAPHSSTVPAPQGPPELDADETLAGRQGMTTGNASIAFGEGRKGDALIIAVRCQGTGRMRIAVRPVHVAFPLRCRADRPSTIYNQVNVTAARAGGVASVEAPPSVHWSMTIARGTPPQEEPPTATTGSL
ncbi:hypothetical protein ABZ478_04425 [Streptomyces sp. NPDC005706]|uniref:hypothetical protein n=1 Tax=Streptomyces sp. NPDC005706 TaxID=3157169 RepID=UPI003403440A